MICIWSSWCYCHPIISCFSKIQNGLAIWCRLTQVVLEKRPLNVCVCAFHQITHITNDWFMCCCCSCVPAGQGSGRTNQQRAVPDFRCCQATGHHRRTTFWLQRQIMEGVAGLENATLVSTFQVSDSHSIHAKVISSCHSGRHAKIFGWAKSAAYDRLYRSDLWPITHNSGIGDKQKSCVMCVKFSKEW